MGFILDHPTATITGVSQQTPRDDADRELPRLIVAFQGRKPFVPALRLCLGHVDEVQIGRGSMRSSRRAGRRLELTLDDHEISRSHVSLRRTQIGWDLSDLGSKNGTRINGARTTRGTRRLRCDRAGLGPVDLPRRSERLQRVR